MKLAKRFRAGKILWEKTKPDLDPPQKFAKKVVDLNELEH
jgi:hypothetical protein